MFGIRTWLRGAFVPCLVYAVRSGCAGALPPPPHILPCRVVASSEHAPHNSGGNLPHLPLAIPAAFVGCDLGSALLSPVGGTFGMAACALHCTPCEEEGTLHALLLAFLYPYVRLYLVP
jgi:hypothetical protein